MYTHRHKQVVMLWCFKLLLRLNSPGLQTKEWILISADAHHVGDTSLGICRLYRFNFSCLIKSNFMKLSFLCRWSWNNFGVMLVFGGINLAVSPQRRWARCHVWVSRNILGVCTLLTAWQTAAGRPAHESFWRVRWFFHYIEVLEFTQHDSWILLCRQNLPHLGTHFNKHISQVG